MILCTVHNVYCVHCTIPGWCRAGRCWWGVHASARVLALGLQLFEGTIYLDVKQDQRNVDHTMEVSEATFLKINLSVFLHLSESTGCSLNIVFFPIFKKYSGLWPLSVFPRCQCVYTHQAGRTQAQQQNWQSSEKSQNFKEKHNI